MWKPANPPTSNQPNSNPAVGPTQTKPTPTPSVETRPTPAAGEPTPAPANRNAVLNTQEQATIGKSLVIKGEVTGSESLYIDGKVEGSIQLPGNRVTIGRNGQVSANINAREEVVLGKVRGNLNASDRVDIRNEGSLTGDVVAQRISIEDDDFFKGGIDIRKPGQQNQKDTKEPVSILESSPAAAARA